MFENPWIEATARVYRAIYTVGSNLQSLFLLFLRLTWGLSFFHIGMGKFEHIPETVAFFQSSGIPLPLFNAYLVAFVEAIGGLCLFFGFGARFASVPLTFLLFVAYGTVHAHAFKDFAFIKNPSLLVQEAPFPFLITTLTVFLFGPGRISIDAWIKRISAHWPKY